MSNKDTWEQIHLSGEKKTDRVVSMSGENPGCLGDGEQRGIVKPREARERRAFKGVRGHRVRCLRAILYGKDGVGTAGYPWPGGSWRAELRGDGRLEEEGSGAEAAGPF